MKNYTLYTHTYIIYKERENERSVRDARQLSTWKTESAN